MQGDGKQRYYKVRFDDGDMQDFSLRELRHILVDELPTNIDEQTGAAQEALQGESLSETQPILGSSGTASRVASSSKDGALESQPQPQHADDADLLMNLVN